MVCDSIHQEYFRTINGWDEYITPVKNGLYRDRKGDIKKANGDNRIHYMKEAWFDLLRLRVQKDPEYTTIANFLHSVILEEPGPLYVEDVEWFYEHEETILETKKRRTA